MERITHAKYYKIKNNLGMEVTFCNFGAALYAVRIKKDYVTFAPMHKKTFITCSSYYGKIVGPICGRIKDGLIVSKYGNKQLVVDSDDGVILHSGKQGFSYCEFNCEGIKESLNHKTITFTRDYVDEVNDGFFDAFITVSYRVSKFSNKIVLSMSITPKHDTYYSMTSHTYFNMSPDEKVLKESLMINGDEVANLDNKLLLKEWNTVNEIFDFRKPKLIGTDIRRTYPLKACGYDHPYKLNKGKPQIVLTGNKYELTINSSFDGVVVYTNNYAKVEEHILGRGYNKQYDAIAIEPQSEPFNFDKMFIKAGETRTNYIEYVFTNVGDKR